MSRSGRTDATQHAREEKLRRLLQIDSVAVMFFDRHGALIDANGVFLRLTGYSREDLKRRRLSWQTLTPPEWMPESRLQMAQFDVTGRLGPYEKEYLCKDGSRTWMLIAGRDMDDGTFVKIGVDIEQHKRTALALRRSEEQHSFLLGFSDALRRLSSPEELQAAACISICLHLDVDSIVYCEIEAADCTAVGARHGPAGAVVQYAPDCDESLRTLARQVVERGVPLVIEDTGSEATAEASIRALVATPVARGEPRSAVLIVRSQQQRAWSAAEVELLVEVAERIRVATERVRTAQALRRSEVRFRRLFDSMEEGFCILERISTRGAPLDFRFVEINGALLPMLAETFLVGRTLREVFPDFPEELIGIHERVACTGVSIRFEHSFPITGKTLEFNVFRPGTEAANQVAVLCQDISQRKLAETLLAESEHSQRALIEGIPQFVWRADRDGQWTWTSSQWATYTGQPASDSLAWGWLAMLHPADRNRVRQAWDQARQSGRLEVDFRIRHADSDAYLWFQTRASPVHDQAGAVIEWLGTSTDVDELHNLQLRQQALAAELQHRTRNLLGVIRSLAKRIGSTSVDFADFQARFHDRLEALARAQSLLSRLSEQRRVTFDELLASELDAVDAHPGQIKLDGPQGIRLKSSTVQTLALALHELLTNAVKYGALSEPQAKLNISWFLQSGAPHNSPWLHIDWRETGVHLSPEAWSDARSGQGRELIERALPYQLHARTQYRIDARGVHCTIAIPTSSMVTTRPQLV